ncbi:hypothetical protein AMK59_2711 [Oryctes borbonicus]|uniref:Uncharacterized protein n=1 Tax=Oryctes borbonicus TaxID=1629725 RepID=A0A0T6BBK1_9SCAR|nr:hypothetical protein AMK59_2711 [Oryctes borbonicus]
MKSLEVIAQENRTSPTVTTKPTYKEYQKFLSTYNESKSDQQPESPIALSTNSSSSSVPSMISETDSVPVAFADYLQSYGNKKYSTVRPNLPKKNVKTEIFIQVNEEDNKEALFGRKFNTLKSRKPPGKVILARQNSLNKCDSNNWKAPLSPAGHQVLLSPPPPKQFIVPDEMIYAKTALLSELSSKPPKLSKSPSPTFKSTIEVVAAPPMSLSSLPPPPPKLPDFTSKPPPISASVSKITPAATAPSPKFTQPRPSFISEMQSRFNENSQNPLPGRLSINGTNQTAAGKKSPPLLMTANLPPKLFAQLSKSSEHEVDSVRVAQNGINGKKSPPLANWNSDVPPPPPKCPPPSMKSINLEIKPVITTQTVQMNGSPNGRKLSSSSLPPPPKFLTQHPKSLEMEGSTTTYVPVADTSANVDKSDPNVKKLVYNTYRGLLGAYNNRANNMVTMPRNRVVQDQGIAKQLESIELQGCLDKLNGRVNPNAENE